MTLLKYIFIILYLVFAQVLFGQSNEAMAKMKGLEAEPFEANRKVDEAIKLLNEATKFDPSNIDYPLRIVYGYVYKKEYDSAIKILNELTNHKDVSDVVYQELGNVYHFKGNSKKAIKTYKKGLTFFPNSGKLYCEIGNVYRIEKEPYRAIEFYEKAIEVEPTFLPSYHRVSLIYCIGTTIPIWGLLYGEVYMNLQKDDDSYRSIEISQRLFTTYKYSISFTKDTLEKISFYDYQHSNDKNYKFGICFEDLFRKSITTETKISLATLNTIRTKFLDLYYNDSIAKKYPNAILDYQKKVKDIGHFEAYNYWLFRDGDKMEFEKWKKENNNKWSSFIEWFKQNKMQINNENKFYKDQY